jgi:hypothetical protein
VAFDDAAGSGGRLACAHVGDAVDRDEAMGAVATHAKTAATGWVHVRLEHRSEEIFAMFDWNGPSVYDKSHKFIPSDAYVG